MNPQKVGANIKNARKKLGLTQAEAAKKVGIHPNYYARIERGDAEPRTKTFEKIFKALKVKSSDIFPF